MFTKDNTSGYSEKEIAIMNGWLIEMMVSDWLDKFDYDYAEREQQASEYILNLFC
jgi:hypothetical protein